MSDGYKVYASKEYVDEKLSSSGSGISTPVTIAQGGTGATTAEAARTALGAASSSHSHSNITKATSSYSGSMNAGFVDQSQLYGIEVTGSYSNSDSTTMRLSLRADKDTGLLMARVDRKNGDAIYPTFYTTTNKPTLEDLGNVHVSTTTPTSLTNGHWYLVKA